MRTAVEAMSFPVSALIFSLISLFSFTFNQESFMTPVNPFILKNKEKMVNFLDELSVS